MKKTLNKKLEKKMGLNMDYLKVLLLLLFYLVVFICIVVIDKNESRISTDTLKKLKSYKYKYLKKIIYYIIYII
jgi:hypothetical protein